MPNKDPEKPDFSAVTPGGSSTAPPATPTPPTETLYTVVSGDSLSRIAKRLYGDAGKWQVIFEANTDQIKDPDLIHPGQILKIPTA